MQITINSIITTLCLLVIMIVLYKYLTYLCTISIKPDNLVKCIKEIKKDIQPILDYRKSVLENIQDKLKNSEFKNIKKLNTTQWNSKQLMTLS